MYVLLNPLAPQLSTLFHAGQTLLGHIVNDGTGLALQIANTRIPIQDAKSLPSGTRVHVTVEQGRNGLVLRVSPRSPQLPTNGPTPPRTFQALEAVLRALPELDQAQKSVLAQVVPRSAPLTENAVRVVISMFITDRYLGPVLQTIAGSVRRAVEAGSINRGLGESILRVIGRMTLSDAESLEAVLRTNGEAQRLPAEARLARLASGLTPEHAEDLRTLLARAKEDPGLRAFLKGAGDLDGFLRAVDTVETRLVASHLQNLHNQDFPYTFLELPASPETGIERIHLHIFGDQEGDEDSHEGKLVRVVLDISTARLGEIWVVLFQTGQGLLCELRTRSEEVRHAIDENAESLEKALERAGFSPARVDATIWEGDRIRELGAMLGRSTGFEATV